MISLLDGVRLVALAGLGRLAMLVLSLPKGRSWPLATLDASTERVAQVENMGHDETAKQWQEYVGPTFPCIVGCIT